MSWPDGHDIPGSAALWWYRDLPFQRDPDAELTRALERVDREAEALADVARRAAEDGELQEAIARMVDAPLIGLRCVVELLCRRHRITVRWTRGAAVPGQAIAHANWRTRTITTPFIATIEDGAVALHEIGHVLEGECAGAGHHRDTRETRWWNCVECERSAWARALKLAPFTPTMQWALAQALRVVLVQTPAPPDVQAAARRLASGTTWREETHRRIEHEVRQMKIAEIDRIARDARKAL